MYMYAHSNIVYLPPKLQMYLPPKNKPQIPPLPPTHTHTHTYTHPHTHTPHTVTYVP